MTYTLHITRHTLLDLQEAMDYITFQLFNPDAADRLQQKFERKMEELCDYPEKYPPASDEVLRNWNIRFTMVGNYYVFYTVRENRIYIIRFLYKRRDWMTLLHRGFDPAEQKKENNNG